MRLLVFFFLTLTCFPYAIAADTDDFSGVWVGWLCPRGVKNDPVKCANLVLELFQKKDKLCGTHVFASAGADSIDEGKGASVIGQINGDTATMTINSASASQPQSTAATLTLVKGQLLWRLEDSSQKSVLPLKAQLNRSSKKTLSSALFAQQLQAACR